jgi:hypothetical protein
VEEDKTPLDRLLELANVLRPEMLPVELERALIEHPVYVLLLAPALLPIVEVLEQVDEILERLDLGTVKVLHLKPLLPVSRRVGREDSIKCIIAKHSLSCDGICDIFKVDEIFDVKEEVLPECLVEEPYYKTKHLIIKVLARTVQAKPKPKHFKFLQVVFSVFDGKPTPLIRIL